MNEPKKTSTQVGTLLAALEVRPALLQEVQHLVPAQNAIGGTEYWAAIHLPNGRMNTDSLESAQSYFQEAQKNFNPNNVRIVCLETTAVSSP